MFLVRINPDQFTEGLEYVEEIWENLYPDYPFSYFFTADLYRQIYRQDIGQAKTLSVISLLSIIIACLGLLGLMRYLAGARTREIGIRKANGASSLRILLLLNRDFLIMIILSLAIGIPGSVFLVRYWLQNFLYRVEVQWWIYGLAALGFLLISILTVSYRAWKAASQNPLKSLRYE